MTVNIRRGCGYRVAGGVYLVTEFSPYGTPLRLFLFDPPMILRTENGEMWNPGARGIHLAERPDTPGVVDAYDWIGEEYYPFFPDFWEEGKRFEFSRRAQKNLDFSLLSPQSQIIGVHPLGLPAIAEFTNGPFREHNIDHVELPPCPFDDLHHIVGDEFCISTLWQLVGNKQFDKPEERLHTEMFPRHLTKGEPPTFTYTAAYPFTDFDNKWLPAAMYHLPISRIEIVRDVAEGKHEETYEKIYRTTALPVEVVDE